MRKCNVYCILGIFCIRWGPIFVACQCFAVQSRCDFQDPCSFYTVKQSIKCTFHRGFKFVRKERQRQLNPTKCNL